MRHRKKPHKVTQDQPRTTVPTDGTNTKKVTRKCTRVISYFDTFDTLPVNNDLRTSPFPSPFSYQPLPRLSPLPLPTFGPACITMLPRLTRLPFTQIFMLLLLSRGPCDAILLLISLVFLIFCNHLVL